LESKGTGVDYQMLSEKNITCNVKNVKVQQFLNCTSQLAFVKHTYVPLIMITYASAIYPHYPYCRVQLLKKWSKTNALRYGLL